MFSDPFTAVMALILLAFMGTLAVFFRIWRELDVLRAALRDIRENLRFYAVDSAQHNKDLTDAIRELREWRELRETRGGETRREGGDGLGELLERGLPNLAGAQPPLSVAFPAFGRREAAPGHGKLSLGHAEPGGDEDLIRRLGDGIGTGAAPK